MKSIEVVAAIIMNESRVFATQRGYGDFKGSWEFPGGKIEQGETREEALIREIREELASEILITDCLTTVEYDYPQFHLILHCFICKVVGGSLTLKEHQAAVWLGREELDSVDWLPADIQVINELRNYLKDKTKVRESNKCNDLMLENNMDQMDK